MSDDKTYRNVKTAGRGLPLLVGLAAVLLIPMSTANAQTPTGELSYSVKFVCGDQSHSPNLGMPVAPGFYATEINIHNPHRLQVDVRKHVLVVVRDGKPVGREPRVVYPTGSDGVSLPNDHMTMDDCVRIRQILGLPPTNSLLIGYFEIITKLPLAVTAVYTSSRDPSVAATSPAIDVERIQPTKVLH